MRSKAEIQSRIDEVKEMLAGYKSMVVREPTASMIAQMGITACENELLELESELRNA